MAADRIPINRSRQPGNMLVRSADLLNELRNLTRELGAIGNHGNDGVDYAVMEADFGLAAGAGPNTLALINILDDTLNTVADKPGVDRLGQLDEYVARIAGQ